MSQRMTAERITSEQNNVDCQHYRADANSKSVWKPKRFPNVMGEGQKKKQGKIEKITMHILHDERERPFAPIAPARLAYRACGQIGPERLIVRPAIVITGQPESSRRPKNNQRGRKDEPMWPPVRLRSKPTMRRIAKKFRRIKWRNVIAEKIIRSLKCRPGGINDED